MRNSKPISPIYLIFYTRSIISVARSSSKAGHRSPVHSCISCYWHRALVYIRLSVFFSPAFLRDDASTTCVCLRLREQCVRSKKRQLLRVVHVLLLRPTAGNMDVNALASKRSKLIGNAAIVRKRGVIHKRRTVCACVFQLPRVAQKRRNARSNCGGLR